MYSKKQNQNVHKLRIVLPRATNQCLKVTVLFTNIKINNTMTVRKIFAASPWADRFLFSHYGLHHTSQLIENNVTHKISTV